MQPRASAYPRARRCFLNSGFRTAPAHGITFAEAGITIRRGSFSQLALPKFQMDLDSDDIPMTPPWLDVASRRKLATVMLIPPGTWADLTDEGELHRMERSMDTRHEAVTRQMAMGKVLWGMVPIAIE